MSFHRIKEENMKDRRRFDRRDDNVDSPMYSRLFVVCAKGLSENVFSEAFSKYGEIEDIHLPRDNVGNMKGLAYIKFAKTSEAAYALEAMNLQTLPGSSRPLKVMVAANRSELANDDFEKYRRLFITVPKVMTENEIEKEFKNYGHITSIILQKDHKNGDSKGFAYISYAKFSQAAQAFEQCNKMYRAIFAKPKSLKRPETAFESRIDNLARTSNSMNSPHFLVPMMNSQVPLDGYTRVIFLCWPQLNQMQVQQLFDLIPGMVTCQYFVDPSQNVGKGTVCYSNSRSAAYAVEKLNEFEYPPGMKILVKPDVPFGTDNNYNHNSNDFNMIPNAVSKLKKAIEYSSNSSGPDLVQLAEAIAEASNLIKKATGNGSNDVYDSNDLSYCSVKLPAPQPLAHIDCVVVKRCFLVCKPSPPPLTVLRDVFCRFGALINVYTLPNKTVGYARYATAKAADEAIKVLHGAEICGVRMKVLQAEEEAPPRKRERLDHDSY